jgi:hypothetical protein
MPKDLKAEAMSMAGIFLASSEAVMDLAMDIASAQKELHDHHPPRLFRGLYLPPPGSFGLVLVAPCTAVAGGLILARPKPGRAASSAPHSS